MAIARPFRGIRPKKDIVGSFHCPPYDVIDREESKKMASANLNGFLHVTRSEIDLPDSLDEHDMTVYEKAKETLNKFMADGTLFKETDAAYYFYREVWQGREQLGLFAAVSADEYEKGNIRRHEFTRKEKEVDRTNHIHITKTHTEPVFLTYQGHSKINALITSFCASHEPEYVVSDENQVTHTLWVCTDKKTIDGIEREFAAIDLLYIADGHHRTASSLNARNMFREKNPKHTGNEEYNYFMAVIFPSDQLRILPYNRVVKDLNGNSPDDFLKKLSQVAEIVKSEKDKPTAKHDVSMYLGGEWYTLTFKNNHIPNDAVKQLDVDLLQTLVLDPVLGIKDPRTDNRIKFVGGIRGTDELTMLVGKKGWAVAFSMYPTDINDLIRVAGEFKVMPPKSTWFEPKLRSGLVIHSAE